MLLDIGERSRGDEVLYPNDDIQAAPSDRGQWIFTRKNGTPY